MAASIEQQYPYGNIRKSVISKDWAAGSHTPTKHYDLIFHRASPNVYTATVETLLYPPALLKIIDELIVNALDHYVRCSANGTSRVTTLEVALDSDGRIRVTNDGPGIPVVIHKVASADLKRDVYLPTLLFSVCFQGCNQEPAPDSIVGGTNGLGSKITGLHSVRISVETATTTHYFLQKWSDHMEVEEPPVILDITDPAVAQALRAAPVAASTISRAAPHTTITFMPDYTLFGYASPDAIPHALLEDLIRSRLFFAAAYAGRGLTVTFNGVKLPDVSMASIAEMYRVSAEGAATHTIALIPQVPTHGPRVHYKYPWEVTIVIGGTRTTPRTCFSNVNGIVVREGTHRDHIISLLTAGVRDKLAKMLSDNNVRFTRAHVVDNVTLFINARVPTPAWSSQSKDVLSTTVSRFTGYELSPQFIAAIATQLQASVMAATFTNLPTATGRRRSKQSDYDKYTPARRAGTKDSLKCSLLIAEGDSAIAQMKAGICNSLGWDYYGVASAKGVPINVRRKSTVVDCGAGQHVKATKKMADNAFLTALLEITGLSLSYKYDPASPTYHKEMSELNYGSVIVCVDQDLDGKGNILGLLLSMFEHLWRNLFYAGYIKWFSTPIMRAYPKRKGKAQCNVLSFYDMTAFRRWEADQGGSAAVAAAYDISYYKGLSSHDDEETISMFQSFHQHVHAFGADSRSAALFDIYMGDDPSERRKKLSAPPPAVPMTSEQSIIPCSQYLEDAVHEFQVDDLERKLDHVIDGQNQAGRKILDGSLKALAHGHKMKVAQLAGYIALNENYHHGETTLGDSITGRGFITCGGKQVPLILPASNFGSRLQGGDDAGAARYIFARLNAKVTDLLFPAEDYPLLRFRFDEGVRGEPEYFVPIIPMVLVESTELPAHGWNLKLWARDVYKVIDAVRWMIKHGETARVLALPPATYTGSPYAWKGHFGTIRGEPYSFGAYELKQSTARGAIVTTLVITELPLRVWTEPYIAMLQKKATRDQRIISKIYNESDKLSVRIEVVLRPGALELLDTMADSIFTNGIQEYFRLREPMVSHINLMLDGTVMSFNTYNEVLPVWFRVRRDYYRLRIERRTTLLSLRQRELQNIVRFVTAANAYDLGGLKKQAMAAFLAEQVPPYDRIYSAKITKPGFMPTADLPGAVINGPKATYDYLLGLSYYDRSEESQAEYRAKLDRVTEELRALSETAAVGPFPGAAMWTEELDKLERNIRKGMQTGWKYDDAGRFKYD